MTTEVKIVQLTEGEVRDLVSDSVKQTLAAFGVDVTNPLAMQRDFQHLRDWREAVHGIKRRSMFALISVVVTGGAAALWIGIQHYIKG